MVDVFIYPYKNLKERREITNENTGRFMDLGNCLMFYVNYSDEPYPLKLIKDYEKRIRIKECV